MKFTNMMKMRSTDVNGRSFTEEKKRMVWEKGQIIPGLNPSLYRRDTCGAKICWLYYGDTNFRQGWEIDHIKPVSKGGTDDLSNLQPLQWENNRSKGDDYPAYNFCMVRE